MDEKTEEQLIKIIALDRIDRPISSMSGKIKRQKPKLASLVDLSKHDRSYRGERVWAQIKDEDRQRARGMKEGIEKFDTEFPKYGQILRGYIEEQRTLREVYLYFGVRDNCRLTSQDYMSVMQDLGFSAATSERLYPELMDISRKLARKREESERSILIG